MLRPSVNDDFITSVHEQWSFRITPWANYSYFMELIILDNRFTTNIPAKHLLMCQSAV